MSVTKVAVRESSNPPAVFYAHLITDDREAQDPQGSAAPAFQFAQHKGPSKTKARNHPLFSAPPQPSSDELETFKLLVNQGNEYFKVQNYERAFDYYQRGLKINPRDASVKLKLADTAVKLERAGIAHDFYTERLNLKPDDKETRKKRLNLDQEWLKAMAPAVEKFQKKQGLSEEERTEVKAFLKIVPLLKTEIAVDAAVIQSLEVEEAKNVLDLQFNGKKAELHSLPQEKKKQLIASLDLYLSKISSLAELPLGDPDFAAATIGRLKEIVVHGYGVLKNFAAEDSDPEIQVYADLYAAKNFAASENYAEASKLYHALAERGYAKLGEGDVAAGKQKFESKLAKVEGLQKEMEALQKKKGVTRKGLESGMEEKHKELASVVVDFPPGLADAYQFLLQVEEARSAHNEGLKKLGGGDIEAGRKIAGEKIAEGKKLNEEILSLTGEIRGAAGQFKYGELSKALKSREEKMKAAAELAKSLPSLKFVQSYLMLEQIEISERDMVTKAETAEKERKAALMDNSLLVYKSLLDAHRVEEMAEAKTHWFLIWLAECVGSKSRLDDVSARYAQQLEVFTEAKDLISKGTVANLKEALQQIEKSGTGTKSGVARTLLSSSPEGLSFSDFLELSSSPHPDPAKVKALSKIASVWAADSRLKAAGAALTGLLALIP